MNTNTLNHFSMYDRFVEMNCAVKMVFPGYTVYTSQICRWPEMIVPEPDTLHDRHLMSEIAGGIREGRFPNYLMTYEPNQASTTSPLLRKTGFRPVWTWTEMVLDLISSLSKPSTVTAVMMKEVTDQQELIQFADLVREFFFETDPEPDKLRPQGWSISGFRPHFTLLLAMDGGESVGSAALYRCPEGNGAGVYFVGVRSEYRGMGIARALMHNLQGLAFSAGYSRVYLQSTEAGLPLYRSLGYREEGLFRVWGLV